MTKTFTSPMADEIERFLQHKRSLGHVYRPRGGGIFAPSTGSPPRKARRGLAKLWSANTFRVAAPAHVPTGSQLFDSSRGSSRWRRLTRLCHCRGSSAFVVHHVRSGHCRARSAFDSWTDAID
jgi:hypothetical protein